MVYVFLAEGFEEMEALSPVDILRRADISVSTVGVGGKVITGSHGIPVTADITADEVDFADMEAVVLPGGLPGTTNLEKNATVQAALEYAAENGLWIAAICAAPSVLGHKGLLKGHRAICFPGFESELAGAEISKEYVVTDGRIITARGAGVAQQFCLALVSALCSPQKAAALKETMQCR